MMTLPVEIAASRLASVIREKSDIAVALSGGIDSLVLSAAVHETVRNSQTRYTLFHAVSAAVSRQATERVLQCARDFSWNLRLIEVNESLQDNYRSNPLDRCFYCKTALYGTIRQLTSAAIFSGTNVDDLGDFRPGLKAAGNYGVLHPFVMAGIGKDMVRQLACFYGLEQFADLPASPCLASRVETGIPINEDELLSIDKIEQLISERFACQTVRCRLRGSVVVIELDGDMVSRVAHELKSNQALVDEIRSLLAGKFSTYPIDCAEYARGSAFLQVKS